MDDKEPISRREWCYLFFPRWVVDYLLAPFPDESGWSVVLCRWLLEGITLALLVFLFVPPQLVEPLLSGVAWVFTALFLLVALYVRRE